MTSTSSVLEVPNQTQTASIRAYVERAGEDLLASFPKPAQLSGEERRVIIAAIARSSKGIPIYWMTAAHLAVGSEEARSIIVDNLHEEVRDCHPGMMRRFAMAAHALPTDSDAQAVYRNLMNVRLFVGRLSAVRIVLMMMFFEGFLQRFMPYLAELAQRQGSEDLEYADVHGVCDIVHSEGLFRALQAEMALTRESLTPATDLFEGVELFGG